MNRRTVLRFSGIAFAAGLAGCSDGSETDDGTPTGDGNGDGTDETETETPAETGTATQTETETEPETTDTGPEILIVNLENENGDPVWSGISVTVESPGSPPTTHNVTELTLAESGGQFTIQHQNRPGEYTVIVEGEDIDTVEEQVSVSEGSEKEVTIVVEGHPGDTPTGTAE